MKKLNQQLNHPAKVSNFGRVNRFQLFPTTRLKIILKAASYWVSRPVLQAKQPDHTARLL